jgi:hypothetical protein
MMIRVTILPRERAYECRVQSRAVRNGSILHVILVIIFARRRALAVRSSSIERSGRSSLWRRRGKTSRIRERRLQGQGVLEKPSAQPGFALGAFSLQSE